MDPINTYMHDDTAVCGWCGAVITYDADFGRTERWVWGNGPELPADAKTNGWYVDFVGNPPPNTFVCTTGVSPGGFHVPSKRLLVDDNTYDRLVKRLADL